MKTHSWIFGAMIVALLFAAGCSKTVMKNDAAADLDTQSTIESGPAVAEASLTPASKVRLPEPDARELFLNQMVYFNFDSDVLTMDAQTLLQRKARWLRENPDVVKLLIEGHCDARGTDAYNMALGERRAQAVKDYLLDLGVAIESLETLSYGEEKPAVHGNGEEIWSKNRRASFIIN